MGLTQFFNKSHYASDSKISNHCSYLSKSYVCSSNFYILLYINKCKYKLLRSRLHILRYKFIYRPKDSGHRHNYTRYLVSSHTVTRTLITGALRLCLCASLWQFDEDDGLKSFWTVQYMYVQDAYDFCTKQEAWQTHTANQLRLWIVRCEIYILLYIQDKDV